MAFKYATLLVVLSISCLLALGEAHQSQSLDHAPVKPNVNWTKINGIVDQTIHMVQNAVAIVLKGVINESLDDPTTDAVEKQCLRTCRDNYVKVSVGVTRVLKDFSKTHDFTEADDYLNHIVHVLLPCTRCQDDLHKGESGEKHHDDFNVLLESIAVTSADQIDRLLHG